MSWEREQDSLYAVDLVLDALVLVGLYATRRRNRPWKAHRSTQEPFPTGPHHFPSCSVINVRAVGYVPNALAGAQNPMAPCFPIIERVACPPLPPPL